MPQVKKPTKVNDSLRRLRHIVAATPPVCCGMPMEQTFLNTGDMLDGQRADFTEQQSADYLEQYSPLPPVWTCGVCQKESDIEGLDWPTPETVASVDGETASPAAEKRWSFCPHCGERLEKGPVPA